MEAGPRFIVPSDGLEKPGIEPATPGLQGLLNLVTCMGNNLTILHWKFIRANRLLHEYVIGYGLLLT